MRLVRQPPRRARHGSWDGAASRGPTRVRDRVGPELRPQSLPLAVPTPGTKDPSCVSNRPPIARAGKRSEFGTVGTFDPVPRPDERQCSRSEYRDATRPPRGAERIDLSAEVRVDETALQVAGDHPPPEMIRVRTVEEMLAVVASVVAGLVRDAGLDDGEELDLRMSSRRGYVQVEVLPCAVRRGTDPPRRPLTLLAAPLSDAEQKRDG